MTLLVGGSLRFIAGRTGKKWIVSSLHFTSVAFSWVHSRWQRGGSLSPLPPPFVQELAKLILREWAEVTSLVLVDATKGRVAADLEADARVTMVVEDITVPGIWSRLIDTPGMSVFHLAAIMSGELVHCSVAFTGAASFALLRYTIINIAHFRSSLSQKIAPCTLTAHPFCLCDEGPCSQINRSSLHYSWLPPKSWALTN